MSFGQLKTMVGKGKPARSKLGPLFCSLHLHLNGATSKRGLTCPKQSRPFDLSVPPCCSMSPFLVIAQRSTCFWPVPFMPGAKRILSSHRLFLGERVTFKSLFQVYPNPKSPKCLQVSEWRKRSQARSPSSALLLFLGGGFPYQNRLQKEQKLIRQSNLCTGGPRSATSVRKYWAGIPRGLCESIQALARLNFFRDLLFEHRKNQQLPAPTKDRLFTFLF